MNGSFYGTTFQGGVGGSGTVFKITPRGKLTTLYSFCSQMGCADGGNPLARLVLATDGAFYGTTNSGGTGDDGGTVFKITPQGKLTTLYSFCSQTNCSDGAAPGAGLVQAASGSFYGTTNGGGTGDDSGTVFKITPQGKLTTLYSFCSQTNCSDGIGPGAGLVQATNGNFYGTTSEGGVNRAGTVFKITPQGKLTTLYSFCSQPGCADGSGPSGGLVQAANGNFYGTTYEGGVNRAGTVFTITPEGKLTTLHSFDYNDGFGPSGGLVQAANGKFYGTTYEVIFQDRGPGTIFEITSGGNLTTLYSFCSQPSCIDGEEPDAGLMQATNGKFYGTTTLGGTDGFGTVFRLALGLRPFVETLPMCGKVGEFVIILGNNLMGASSVTFNGTAAAFTVVSSTEITTAVPRGATTGKVVVITPSAQLTSNVNFRVR